MRVIYVAGPYRGKSDNEVFENIMRARTAARKLWASGWAVICPHLNSAFMGGISVEQGLNHEDDQELFILGDIEILSRCDAIYMLNGWESSVGAKCEHQYAKHNGLEVFYEP